MQFPKRVEILVASGARYFKAGQFAYVIGSNDIGGMHFCHESRVSEPGEVAYLVSKSKHGAGGALWFAASALRFTATRQKGG